MTDHSVDPLFGTPPARVQLSSAPLVRVLAQVQFSPITKIAEESYIRDFQEEVRHAYPTIRQEIFQTVQFNLDGGTAAPHVQPSVVWRLHDITEKWRVSLTPTAITLETTAYTSRPEFLERMRSLIELVAKTLHPSIAVRAGYRYANRIEGDALDGLPTLLRPEMASILGDNLSSHVEQELSFVQCRSKEGMLLVRWGKLPSGASHDPELSPPMSGPSWILDIDSFKAEGINRQPFNAASLSVVISDLADRAYAFFRWSITDEFLSRFGGAKSEFRSISKTDRR